MTHIIYEIFNNLFIYNIVYQSHYTLTDSWVKMLFIFKYSFAENITAHR